MRRYALYRVPILVANESPMDLMLQVKLEACKSGMLDPTYQYLHVKRHQHTAS